MISEILVGDGFSIWVADKLLSDGSQFIVQEKFDDLIERKWQNAFCSLLFPTNRISVAQFWPFRYGNMKLYELFGWIEMNWHLN